MVIGFSRPRSAVVVLTAVAALILAWAGSVVPAAAAQRQWLTTGVDNHVVASDCWNCGDGASIMISCQGAGQPALVEVPALAAESRRNQRDLAVTIDVGAARYSYVARQEYWGQIGYVPLFTIAPGDPLMGALQSGQSARIHLQGAYANITLYGSRMALTIFKAHCGWGRPAAANSGESGPPVPAFIEDLFAKAGLAKMPSSPTAGQDTPVWTVDHYYDDKAGGTRYTLDFGVPGTDLSLLSTNCVAGDTAAIPFYLSVKFGKGTDGSRIGVRFDLSGQWFHYRGMANSTGQEWNGVRVDMQSSDPLWRALPRASRLVVGAVGYKPISLSMAGARASIATYEQACGVGPHRFPNH